MGLGRTEEVKKKDRRDDFPNKVKQQLAKRVGHKCSNPSCGQATSGPSLSTPETVNMGVAAHITAASPGGTRYDSSLTSKQRRSYDNGIWLCKYHGDLVDKDPATYPVELLRAWKTVAEHKAGVEVHRLPQSVEDEASEPEQREDRLENWLGGIIKQFGLGGIDSFPSKRGKQTAKRLFEMDTTSALSGVESIVNLINSSPKVGNKLQVVMGPGRCEPNFVSDGRLQLAESIRRCAKEIVKQFPDNYSNDPCAAVLYPPNWSDVPLTIHYHNLSYAEILALREDREYVGIITANVLLFSEDGKCLLVHRRSHQSAHYSGALHTFGGAFIPPGSGPREDHSGIRRAALREIFEESEAGIYISNQTPCVVIDEKHIQFIQTAFLGVNVSPDQADSLKRNWEGDQIRIGFAQLKDKMLDMDAWTPTGWVHVLLWLALNAPGSRRPIRFGGDSSADLSRSIIIQCL